MDWKKLVLALALATPLAGCPSDPAPTTNDAYVPPADDAGMNDAGMGGGTDAGQDAGMPVDAFMEPPDAFMPACDDTDQTNGTTELYVVSIITIPTMPGTNNTAYGFDIDGVDDPGDPNADTMTAACERYAPDFTSISNSSEMGVDNQLAGALGMALGALIPGGLDATLLEQINEGSLLLAIRVSDIDDIANDCNVQVSLYLAEVPGGGMPVLTGMNLSPGQTFNEGMSLGASQRGAITSGRLRVSAPSLPLALDISGTSLALTLSNATVEGDITATGMTNGNIGASITVPDLVAAADALGFGAIALSLVDQPGLTDLDFRTYTVTVGGMAMTKTGCSAISAGLGFTAVDVMALNP